DVVGFTRKNHQRLDLRFPTKACHCSRVSFSIDVSAYTVNRRGFDVCKNGRIIDCLDEASPEQWSRYSEDQILMRVSVCEIGLGDIASAGVGSAGDREEIVNTAVTLGLRLRIDVFESRFANRSVNGNKSGDSVRGSRSVRGGDLRVNGWTRAS